MRSLQRVFRDLPDQDVAAAEAAFTTRQVGHGVRLITEGRSQDGLFFIESGKVDVEAAGLHVTTLEEGSFFGEMALFYDGQRTATVTTDGDCRLRCLGKEDYFELRAKGSLVAPRVERLALESVARRFSELCDTISPLASRQKAYESSGKLDPGVPTMSPSSMVVRALRPTRPFLDAPEIELTRLADLGRIKRFNDGFRLVTANDKPPGYFIVLAGEVELCVAVGDALHPVAVLGRGAGCSAAALVRNESNKATWRAVGQVTALVIEPTPFDQLVHAKRDGSLLRVSVIRDLAEQVNLLNGASAMLELLGR